MKQFFCLLLIAASISVYSQNFKTVSHKRAALFSNENAEFLEEYYNYSNFSIAIDSFKVNGGDTLYHHFYIMRYVSTSSCESLKEPLPNWTGSKTVLKATGENVFVTKDNDSIRIFSKPNPGATWHFIDFDNGNYFEAEVINKYEGTILGLTDSIKVISLQLKDNLGNNLSHDFNDKEIIVSKSYGFIKAYDFYSFPEDTSAFHLVGLSDPKVGFYPVTARDVFDFNIDDEFHIDDAYTNVPTNGTFKKERHIVLDKRVSANLDTLVYEVERLIYTEFYDWANGTNSKSFTKDTVIEKYILSNYPNLLLPSFKFFCSLGHPFELSVHQDVSEFENRKALIPITHYSMNEDSCIEDVIDATLPRYYFEGLGGAYYDDDHLVSPNHFHRNLIYYKKADETYGTPIDFTTLSVKKPAISTNVIISPNPFSGTLKFELKNSIPGLKELVIFDSQGKKAASYTFTENEFTVTDPTLQGLFFYKIYQNNIELASGSIVGY